MPHRVVVGGGTAQGDVPRQYRGGDRVELPARFDQIKQNADPSSDLVGRGIGYFSQHEVDALMEYSVVLLKAT